MVDLAHQDELVWAAAWLHRATNSKTYLDYLGSKQAGGTRMSFSWDDKYVGAQILVAKVYKMKKQIKIYVNMHVLIIY